MARRRLDVRVAELGLAESRSRAQALVMARRVTVDGTVVDKAGTPVGDEQLVEVVAPPRYVSRGGEKLETALRTFAIDVTGERCLDVGASTGGFTDCLLQAGAARVTAIDVGYGQLAWEIRNDPRVTVMERTNVRNLEPADVPFAPDLVVADLSFISLRAALTALVTVSDAGAEFIVLVKPQFEAGPADVGSGGVVRDPAVWRRVLTGMIEAFRAQGIGVLGVMASPLRGPAGNVEFLLHGRRGVDDAPIDLNAAIAEGEGLTG
jgi:23S rRNA (cytidine1920-2'-O)/16S rRNA (cytidine1409-2'-O)-methyltransferase